MVEAIDRREFLKFVAIAPLLPVNPLTFKPSASGESEETGHNILNELMAPFIYEAGERRRRNLLAQGEKVYEKRVDPELNAERANFLFSISGYNFEPPAMKIPVILESHTLISFNQTTGKLDSISLTHDTRAPEIERYIQRDDDGPIGPIKISESRRLGGFGLARRVFEDATGLAVDFQLALKEDTVVTFVDNVVGGLKVNVPQSFDVMATSYQDIMRDPVHFEAGVQTLDGLKTIQFIKAVPSENGNYDKRLEHNARKFIIFEALGQSLKEHALDLGFWFTLSGFLKESFNKKSKTEITCDFNPAQLILEGMPSLISKITWAKIRGKKIQFDPYVDKSVYVVDGRSGDGGVTWITSDDNPITKRDLANGVYTDKKQGRFFDMEIALHGDPYADNLAEGYWKSVRQLVKAKLTS